jgi:hypothetical protein
MDFGPAADRLLRQGIIPEAAFRIIATLGSLGIGSAEEQVESIWGARELLRIMSAQTLVASGQQRAPRDSWTLLPACWTYFSSNH